MGRYGDPLTGQQLGADPTGDAQGGGEPPGEVAAAPHILKAAVLDVGGEVGMRRAGLVPQLLIVSGAGVGVLNDGGQGRAAGHSIHQPAQDPGHIPLLPGGGGGVPAGGPAAEKGLELLQVHGLPGGQAVHRHPDGLRVGLTEDGDMDVFTEV